MTAIINFAFEDHLIRSITIDGEPWFVASDVCRVLELPNVGQAISRLDEDEKNTIIISDGNRGNPNQTIINESGLYSLILTSRKPQARAFKKWVTASCPHCPREHNEFPDRQPSE